MGGAAIGVAAIYTSGEPQAAQSTALLAQVLGYQAALTAMLQAMLARVPPSAFRAGAAVLTALGIAAISQGFEPGENSPAAWTAVAALTGAGVGCWEGSALVRLAFAETAVRLQLRNGIRSTVLLVGLSATGIAAPMSVLPFLALPTAAVLAGLVVRTARPSGGSVAGLAPVALGVSAGLIYRNDVTIYRTRLIEGDSFAAASVVAACYSAATGVVGILVSSVIMPEMRSRPGLQETVRKYLVRGTPPILLTCLIAAAISSRFRGVPWAIGMTATLALLTCLSTIAATVLHLIRRSSTVYVAGLAGVGIVFFLPTSLLRPALVIENAALLAVFAWLLRRPSTSAN